MKGNFMTSHEYAKKLRALADMLEQAKPFALPSYQENYDRDYGIVNFSYHGEKAGFISAVRSVGAGKKTTYGEYDFEFYCFDGLLRLRVNRESVCRLIKPATPAEYDCEPLLSQEEEAQIGA